jgi:hypothetical protein
MVELGQWYWTSVAYVDPATDQISFHVKHILVTRRTVRRGSSPDPYCVFLVYPDGDASYPVRRFEDEIFETPAEAERHAMVRSLGQGP